MAPDDRVLEIGAGSGYQTAILAELGERVIAVERLQGLAASAQSTLRRLGYENVEIVVGDGSLGWAPGAPYNVIVVSAASPSVPPALIDQLAPGGRLIIPVGKAKEQILQLVLKQEDGTHFNACSGRLPIRSHDRGAGIRCLIGRVHRSFPVTAFLIFTYPYNHLRRE